MSEIQSKIAEATAEWLQTVNVPHPEPFSQDLANVIAPITEEHYEQVVHKAAMLAAVAERDRTGPLLEEADTMAEWLAEWATPDGAEPAWRYQAMRAAAERDSDA